ncbi:hypothetical protein [Nocardia araoensis]|uniref:hypothetical protein n=1 Tax=Nocardia araoensis TaxID=228600 RepID=UPI001C3F2AC4
MSPIEAQAMAAVFGADRPADRPCLIGSSKANVGHLEAGAGIVGLIKATMAIKKGHVGQRRPKPTGVPPLCGQSRFGCSAVVGGACASCMATGFARVDPGRSHDNEPTVFPSCRCREGLECTSSSKQSAISSRVTDTSGRLSVRRGLPSCCR